MLLAGLGPRWTSWLVDSIAVIAHSCLPAVDRESPDKSDTQGSIRSYDPRVTALHHGLQAETGDLLLYASTKKEPKSRRPTDLALGLLSLLMLIITSTVSHIGGNLDDAFASLIGSLPDLLDPMWSVLFWAPLLYVYISGVKTLLREPPADRDPVQLGLVLSATGFFLFGLVETLNISNGYVNTYWLVFGLLCASTQLHARVQNSVGSDS